MSEFLGKSIQIEGKVIHQSSVERLKSLWIARQARVAAKPFATQFNLSDRKQNRAFFCFTLFLEQIIEELKVKPKIAGLIGWSVFQGIDKYSIRNGIIFAKNVDGNEFIIDPLTEGLPLSYNSDLFVADQVKGEIVALRGNDQERVYQIGFLPKKEIVLERCYQVDLTSIFQ